MILCKNEETPGVATWGNYEKSLEFEVAETACHYMGVALAQAALIVDPDIFVIGLSLIHIGRCSRANKCSVRGQSHT